MNHCQSNAQKQFDEIADAWPMDDDAGKSRRPAWPCGYLIALYCIMVARVNLLSRQKSFNERRTEESKKKKKEEELIIGISNHGNQL